ELLAPTRAVGVFGTAAAGFVAQGLAFSCPAEASMLLLCSILCSKQSGAAPAYLVPPKKGLPRLRRTRRYLRGADERQESPRSCDECQDRHSKPQGWKGRQQADSSTGVSGV
ncbi:unnamed protein product, partial [Ectocarpus fasciculatus]